MTHVAELRRILSDGDWHSTAEILRRHPMMVHSRVSDLRKAGYEVEHRTTGRGAAGSEYRLDVVGSVVRFALVALGEPSSAANGGSPSATHDGARPGYEGGSRSPHRQAEPHATSVGADAHRAAPSDLPAHSGRPPEPADGGDDDPRKEMVGEASVPVRLPGQLAIDDLEGEDRCAAFCAQFCPHCGNRYDDHEWHGIGMCVPNPEEDSAA